MLKVPNNKVREKKSLLFIDDILPVEFLGAGYPRSRAIILAANQLGWDVTVYPMLVSGLDFNYVRQGFPAGVNLLREGGGEAGLLSLLNSLKKPFDVVMVSRPHNRLWFAGVLSQIDKRTVGNRLIYDSEAIYTERDVLAKKLSGQHVSDSDARGLIESEIKVMAEGMDAVSCVSSRDVNVWKACQQNLNIGIVELSLPVDTRTNTPPFDDREGLVFVGRLMEQDAPNWRGLMWFINRVFPTIRAEHPGVTLTIIGPYAPNSISGEVDGITWLGAVEDLGPHYDKRRLFIAPVFVASGIPLKIINAVANGLPVTASRRMGELLDWPSEAMPTSDAETDFARNILEIYGNEQLWRATQKMGQALVKKRFSTKTFKKNLRRLLCGS